MQKIVFICDRCGMQVDKIETLYIPYDISIFGVLSHDFELCTECKKMYVDLTKKFYNDRMEKKIKTEESE